MSKWSKPQQIPEAMRVFPGGVTDTLLPPMDEIPDEFKNIVGPNPWIRLQAEWFFEGIDPSRLIAKEGIDEDAAWDHLGACQGSWEPKHEHKVAGVAWLMSLWFDMASSNGGAA